MGTADRSNQAFGIDIGGTGIKGAVVDTRKGELVTERTRILTPHPATPDAVAQVVAQLVREAGWTGEIGATFPAVIKHGVAQSAANVDPAWVGTDADKAFTPASPKRASARRRASTAW
jgi:polyphosphate glucokinase